MGWYINHPATPVLSARTVSINIRDRTTFKGTSKYTTWIKTRTTQYCEKCSISESTEEAADDARGQTREET